MLRLESVRLIEPEICSTLCTNWSIEYSS